MGNILEEIAEKRKADIAVRKQKISPEEMRKKAETIAEKERQEKHMTFPFRQMLARPCPHRQGHLRHPLRRGERL